MARIKVYTFADGNAFVRNAEVISALGENPWTVQAYVMVSATTKARAVELLKAVGVQARESDIRVDTGTFISQLQELDLLSDESVLALKCTSRKGDPIVALTPAEGASSPEVTQVAVSP